MTPIRIGLTGGVGVGKSSVAAMLAELGAQIVSGDELGRIALEQSPESLGAVRQRFGDDVFDANGTLQRRELGVRVFSSDENAKWLTDLTFPRIHELWNAAVEHSTAAVIVLDAALIIEWGIQHELDCLLVVTAPENLVRARLSRVGRLTEEEAAARRRHQVDPEAKAAMASRVIVNDGSLADLQQRVHAFWQEIVEPILATRRKLGNETGN